MPLTFSELLAALENEHRSQITELKKQVRQLNAQLENVMQQHCELQPIRSPSCVEPVKANAAFTLPEVTRVSTESAREPVLMPFKHRFFDEGSNNNRCVSLLKKVVDNVHFEIAIGLLILCNTATMCLEIQYQSLDMGHALRFEDARVNYDTSAQDTWPGAEDFFVFSERLFTLAFLVELLLRLCAHGKSYLFVLPHWLDVLIVCWGLLDWFVSSLSIVDPVVGRLVRMGKVMRTFRMLRVSKVMENLILILRCIRASVSTLCWSFVLLGTCQCVSAMVFSQFVKVSLMDESKDLGARKELFRYYGSFSRSILTMFEIALGNWSPACRLLVDTIGEEYTLVFLIFRCFIGFAILNVVQAVFIQSTMKVAQEDNVVMIMDRKRSIETYKRKLVDLFSQLDMSGDGVITREEFESMMSVPETSLLLGALGVDPSDLEVLFRHLSAGEESIVIDSFIAGASRIRGQSRSMEIVQVMDTCASIDRRLNEIMETFENRDRVWCDSSGTRRDSPPFDFVELQARAPTKSLQCTNLLLKEPLGTLQTNSAVNKSKQLPHTSDPELSPEEVGICGMDVYSEGPIVGWRSWEGSLAQGPSGSTEEEPSNERDCVKSSNATLTKLLQVPKREMRSFLIQT